MKISGYILKFGEEFFPGMIIDKDCKIESKFLGDVILIKDEIGIRYEGEIDMFDFNVGGVVKEREGNLIKSFNITTVSIILKIKE